MPSALETMVKILKLERDQGAKNTAVVGGLAEFCKSWESQARQEARRPAHHILIDEIIDNLVSYDTIREESERTTKLSYLLDRITNRVPAPQEYADRLPDWTEKLKQEPKSSRPESKGPRQQGHSDRRQARPPRSRKPGSPQSKHDFGDDSATWDEDYTGGPQAGELDIKPTPRLSRPPRIARQERSLEESLALMKDLDAPATEIKGIGSKIAGVLEQLDLFTVRDLLYNLPRDYHDYTELQCIRELTPGNISTVIATVAHTSIVIGKNNRKDFLVRATDGSGALSIRFFSQSFLSSQLRPGDQLALSGSVTKYQDRLQMTNPEWEHLDLENLHAIGIVPVYRLTKGLRPRLYRKTIKALSADWAGAFPDPVPVSVLERAGLADLGWAVRQAHFPEGWDHLRHARRRIVFDDLLLLQLAILGNRRRWQSAEGPAITVDKGLLNEFINGAFSFELTKAQKRAISQIGDDVASPVPMNRLIQGDVGSGKTAVAIVAIAMVLQNGMQAALMAPTGILAEQHFRGLSEAFATFPGDSKPVVALLTSALSASERESIHRGILDGSIDIVVGTHALIQNDVEFDNLGIVVIDEQHRFGVGQRALLRGKGRNPHLLVMTATPIPRTLALTIYADLDLTVIDEKPPGRQQVVTRVFDPVARERLHGFVRAQLEQGRQAFFVHPLVEESDTIETASAIEAYEELSQVFFRHRVCLLHGRMRPTEKDQLMADFSRGDYDVMVTTSVAEVGVDVPNATVIVIDGANRFGLAQLHQFRGRVGRGVYQSHCFLIPDRNSDFNFDRLFGALDGEIPLSELPTAEQRLVAMAQTDDGFELAELDWRLRGAGDLLGTRQSGSNQMQRLELVSPELVELAQREARTLYEEDPELTLPEHQLLAARIKQIYRETADLS